MSCRHLNITFLENGDVEYSFFKHHALYKLYKYEIDYPFDQVEIVGGQGYDSDHFKLQKRPNGFALLTWDMLTEKEFGARGIRYIKKGFLKKKERTDGSFTFHYQEQIRIKASKRNDRFCLWLHSPFSKISALKRQSYAFFNGESYKPRELSEIVFSCSGLLKVDWELEILT